MSHPGPLIGGTPSGASFQVCRDEVHKDQPEVPLADLPYLNTFQLERKLIGQCAILEHIKNITGNFKPDSELNLNSESLPVAGFEYHWHSA